MSPHPIDSLEPAAASLSIFSYFRRVNPDGSNTRLWTFLIALPHPSTWNTKGSVLTLLEAAMSSSNALATKEAMMVLLDEVYKVSLFFIFGRMGN